MIDVNDNKRKWNRRKHRQQHRQSRQSWIYEKYKNIFNLDGGQLAFKSMWYWK